ncbi:MAG: hypothetical protein FJY67_01855 [Calditrichaeota bacterium]|nr:hypothetical protein [Calditrichota bacterium]
MTYRIEDSVLIAEAETPEEALELGAKVKAIGTREQIAESWQQALESAQRWAGLIEVYDNLAE